MTLERWLSLFLLGIFVAYGYGAFLFMDAQLPVFAKLSPVWPSSFPKVLAVFGIGLSFCQLVFWHNKNALDLDASKLNQYEWKTVGLMIGLMVAYALLLRPAGFVLSTIGFLLAASASLGERRWLLMLSISAVAVFGIWYLVDSVLGIFLRPWPFFVYGGL